MVEVKYFKEKIESLLSQEWKVEFLGENFVLNMMEQNH